MSKNSSLILKLFNKVLNIMYFYKLKNFMILSSYNSSIFIDCYLYIYFLSLKRLNYFSY